MTENIDITHEFGSAEGYISGTDTEQLKNWLFKQIRNDDVVEHILNYFKLNNIDQFSILNNINISPEEQGKGYGSNLLSEFIEKVDPYPVLLLCDIMEEQKFSFLLENFYLNHDFETIFTIKNYPIMVFPIDFALDLKESLIVKQDKQFVAEWLSDRQNTLTINDLNFKEHNKPISFFQQHIDDMNQYMDEFDFLRINKIKQKIEETGITYPVFIEKNNSNFIMEGRHRIIAQQELGYDSIKCIKCEIKNKLKKNHKFKIT